MTISHVKKFFHMAKKFSTGTNIRYAHASTRLLLYTLPFAFFVFQTEFLYFVKSKVYAGDVTCQFGQFFFFLSSNINSIAAFLSPVNATLRNSFHTVARQFHLINHTYTNLQHTVLQIQVRIQDTFLKIQIKVKIQETIYTNANTNTNKGEYLIFEKKNLSFSLS